MRRLGPGSLLLSAALAAAPALAFAAGAGTSAAPFLKFGAGARAGAMGEAQAGLPGDAYSSYYNPAGLAALSRPTAAGMHESRFQSVDYEFFTLAYPFLDEGGKTRWTAAASVYSLSVSGLERRENDTDLALGQFDAGDSAYALSAGFMASEELSLGATLKRVHSRLDLISAGAWAADFGLLYRLGSRQPVTFGLTARNLGTRLDYGDGAGDPLPQSFAAGASLSPLDGLVADLDLVKPRDGRLYAAFGTEYRRDFSSSFSAALRAGYSSRLRALDGLHGPSAGAGLSYDSVTLDFAWIPFGDLGTNFRYSLSVRF